MSFAEYLASAYAAQTLAYGRGGAQRLLPAGPRLGPARFTAATVSLNPKRLLPAGQRQGPACFTAATVSLTPKRQLPTGRRQGPACFTAATVSLTPKSLYQQDLAKALLASLRLPCP